MLQIVYQKTGVMGKGARGINFLMEGATMETYLLLVLFMLFYNFTSFIHVVLL